MDTVAGLKAIGPLRSLGPVINESSPPSGPPGAASQIIFDPASTGVFALIKGNAVSLPVACILLNLNTLIMLIQASVVA